MKQDEPLTWEKLQAVIDQFKETPHYRIVVSRFALPDTCVKLPTYYDHDRHQHVEMVILGSAAWLRLLKEAAPSAESPLYGIPVEFSPPHWRPDA